MSLDINFMYPIDTYGDTDREYVDISDIWHDEQIDCHLNITHNVGEMASHVVNDNHTLYDLLWRPYRLYNIEEDSDESYSFMPKASELETAIEVCIDKMIENKEDLLQYNPHNGWGSYDSLLAFAKKYLRCIKRYPNAMIEVSR